MSKWLQDPQLIAFSVKDHVATITLNRPEKRNALSRALRAELHAAFMEADDRNEVRCIVLQGAGKDFCAGYDLTPPPEQVSYDKADYRGTTTFDDDSWSLYFGSGAIRRVTFDMFKPVIAKVQGNCLAGGTDLALMCDIIIAANDARIGFPATRSLGSPPGHMWLYHCGPQWAKRLLFTGDSIRGRDAAKIGLVLKAVPKEKLDAEVERLARRIANVPADLLAAHKRIVNLGLELMGTRTMQRLAEENDTRAHQSPAMAGFISTQREFGLKEALRRRDSPFGGGDASLDPEV